MNSWRKRSPLLAIFVLLLAAWLAGCGETPTTEPAPTAQKGVVLSSFTTADFTGPGRCAACHITLKDESGADVSMPNMWRSTMMANAARDPVWQAKVSSEVARLPQLKSEIEKKCTTCHMPMAKTQAVTDGQTVALGDGFYDPDHPLHDAAMDGVSCTLCHQVVEENLGQAESFSGGYQVDTSTEAPDRLIFGPYQQPVAQEMQGVSGFTPVYSTHIGTAEHCGTCHNLFTPYVDAEGKVLGEFPEQTPYTEWQHSQFGAENTSCQSCHMPEAQGGVAISIIPANLEKREPFFQHFFVGGNAFMTQMLSDNDADIGVTAETTHFADTQARVIDQIQNQTAELKLEILELEGDLLTASLRVTALTGHKFPTSFPTRRAWLHVSVLDSTGKVIFHSGQPNDDGTIAGNAADTDPTAYEPHYDTITQADQVQIYEPIMGDSDGKVTYTLLRAGQYLKDNRLLPAGAEKEQLPPEIAVYGEAAGDENFIDGSDVVTYQVAVKDAQGPFTVQAELLYQPLSVPFIMDLLKDETSLTERFGSYYARADKAPLLVTSIQATQTK